MKEQNNNCTYKPLEELNYNKTPVWRLDKSSKEKLQRYDPLKDAVNWIQLQGQGISNVKNGTSKICLVATGGRNAAYGYAWEYDTSEYENAEGGWFDIPPDIIGGVTGYKITAFGKIYNTKGHVCNGWTNVYGYACVRVHPHSYQQHILVAKVFPPENTDEKNIYGNHKDGNTNNNRLSNLEWVTPSENTLHSFSAGLRSELRG